MLYSFLEPPGTDENTFGHAEAQPLPPEAQQHGVPGEVIYGAIHLGVDPSATPPSTSVHQLPPPKARRSSACLTR